MSTKTTNYKLTKPEQTEFYDVDIFNANADIVDTELKQLEDAVELCETTDSAVTRFDTLAERITTETERATAAEQSLQTSVTDLSGSLAAVATSGSYEDLTNQPNTGKGATIYTITADTFSNGNLMDGLPYHEIHDCSGRIIYVCPYNQNAKTAATACSLTIYQHSAVQGALGIEVSSTDDIPESGVELAVVDLGAFTTTTTKQSVIIDGIS